jgi:hypothetical protein
MMDKTFNVMDKILSALPFDRLHKLTTMLGLILIVIPPAYFLKEVRRINESNIQDEGKQRVFSQREKTIERSFKSNIEIIKKIHQLNLPYEENKRRTATFFNEIDSHEKELDQIKVEQINLETNSRILEYRKQNLIQQWFGQN